MIPVVLVWSRSGRAVRGKPARLGGGLRPGAASPPPSPTSSISASSPRPAPPTPRWSPSSCRSAPSFSASLFLGERLNCSRVAGMAAHRARPRRDRRAPAHGDSCRPSAETSMNPVLTDPRPPSRDGDITPQAADRAEPRRASTRRTPPSAPSSRRARPRGDASPRPTGPRARSPASPLGVKDIFDTADMADRIRLADLCRPPPARRMRRSSRWLRAQGRHRRRQDRRPPNSPILTAGGDAQPARSRPTRRAARPPARRRPSPPAWSPAPSARRPAARSSARPPFAASPATSRASASLPMVGVKTFAWSLDTAGFFAASVADVAAFVDAPDRPAARRRACRSARRLRIGLYRTSDRGRGATPTCAPRCRSQPSALAGCRRQRSSRSTNPTALAAAREAQSTIQNFEAGMALGFEYAHHRDRLSDDPAHQRSSRAAPSRRKPTTRPAASRGSARHETGDALSAGRSDPDTRRHRCRAARTGLDRHRRSSTSSGR